jgi:nucleotide-binding universal stress UspA family protein
MKVLIALDDTSYSDAAFRSVEARQWPAGTEFFLCTVLTPYSGSALEDEQVEVIRPAREAWCQQTLKFLDEKAFVLKQSIDNCKVSFDVRIGNVSEQLAKCALDWEADVIVVGSHGRTGMHRYLLGSVAEAIVDTAPCDVEVIKSPSLLAHVTNESLADPIKEEQNRILVCVDGSPNSVAGLDWTMQANWTDNQAFTLLSVIAPVQSDLPLSRFTRAAIVKSAHMEMIKRIEDGLREYTSVLQNRFSNTGFSFEVQEGRAVETILQFADKWKADLIIIGAHDEKLPLEASVARRVAGYAKCSVKIVRADDSREVSISDQAIPSRVYS